MIISINLLKLRQLRQWAMKSYTTDWLFFSDMINYISLLLGGLIYFFKSVHYLIKVFVIPTRRNAFSMDFLTAKILQKFHRNLACALALRNGKSWAKNKHADCNCFFVLLLSKNWTHSRKVTLVGSFWIILKSVHNLFWNTNAFIA